MRYKKQLYFLAMTFLFSFLVFCQKRTGSTAVNEPQKVPFRQEFLQQLKTPEGFALNVFAANTGQPRMMSVGPDGSVYVTRPEQSDVILLMDKNGDGKSDEMKTILRGIPLAHGITIRDNKLYVAGVHELYVSDLNGQNKQKLIGNLPEGGRHPKRTIAFDPKGILYLSIGSTCNSCAEANPEHATILQLSSDASNRKVYARGLRNTIGFDWHPETKEFWGVDNGSDDRGDNIPPEELNLLQEGGDYGWPYCYGNKEVDPLSVQPKGMTKAEYCAKTIGPALTYQAHSAPIEMRFYNNNQFPAEYRGDAFVTMHGSWNRSVPTGFKVVRVRFKNGKPQRFEDFLTGFLMPDGSHQFGRPAGLAIMKDGSLLVSDDENGLIYRVRYKSQTTDHH